MTKFKRALLVGLMAAGLVVAGSAIGPAAAATRGATVSDSHHDFKGSVASINRSAHTFKVNVRGKGIVQFKVNKSTRYEHLKGFGALKKGMRVDVEASRSGNQWIAVHVEREK